MRRRRSRPRRRPAPPLPGTPRAAGRRRALGGGAVVVVVALLSLAVLAFAVRLQPNAPSRPAAAVGVTDREAYRLVVSDMGKAETRRVLGGGPRRVEMSPFRPGERECWLYGRRSGRDGGYRFCFRGDRLEAKERVRPPEA